VQKCNLNYLKSKIRTLCTILIFCVSAIQSREFLITGKKVKIQPECAEMILSVSGHFEGKVPFVILL
jgi:hypothetical protein